MATLDLTPQECDLKLYVGDDPLLQLPFWTDDTKTVPLDLTGFTGWAAQIQSPSGATAAWTVDASQQATGSILLQLNGESVRGFPARGCRWDFRVTGPDGREITLVQGRVAFRTDVTP